MITILLATMQNILTMLCRSVSTEKNWTWQDNNEWWTERKKPWLNSRPQIPQVSGVQTQDLNQAPP